MVFKVALVRIDKALSQPGVESELILQVHDELVFECDEGFVDTLLAEVVPRMCAAAELSVPLVVDSGVGLNWDEAH